ncbi:hypothetical protein SHAL103562_21180 [Shewanella algae]|nr:hypothetical protein TUM3811_23740 [Shewanella algae]
MTPEYEMIEYLKTILAELLSHTVRIQNNYQTIIDQTYIITLYELLERHAESPPESPQSLTEHDIGNIQQLVLEQHDLVSGQVLEITGYPLCQYF